MTVTGRRSRPTLSDIAEAAGVSKATVSKVLNGRSDVAAETRERMAALLKRHNYLAPGSRRARRSGLVDPVINGLDSPWAVEIPRGVESECAERGMGVVVSRVRADDARPPSWTSLTAAHHSDGVILVAPGEIVIAVGRSSADLPLPGSFTLEGPVRELGGDRVLTVPVKVTPW